MPETAFIETSDKDINRLMENIKWTQRSNFIDVPTDCPQRDERLGWSGDIAAFAETAVLQFDTSLFFEKWLNDMRNGQGEDGTVPTVIPAFKELTGMSALWANSVTLVPWNVYLEYGDERVLRQHFPAMCKYLAKMQTLCEDGLIRRGISSATGSRPPRTP